MTRTRETDRFVPPIMQAFRSAFRQRDAGKEMDIKNEAGERVIPGRRSSPRNAVSEAALRQELADDISALLNTVNLAAAQDLKPYSRVQKSILNYGIRDLTAISSDEIAVDSIPQTLVKILSQFESRLVEGSIKVRREATSDDASGRMRYHVTAEMYSTPVDVAVEFVADVETGSGKTILSRL